MANYDVNDLAWSWNGDFDVGHDGDLKDTTSDGLLSLLQEVHTVAASAIGDWEFYPRLGASLEDFIGEPNSKSVGDEIHDRLRLALVSLDLVEENDLDIRIIPVHRHRILVIIKIDAAPTAENSLVAGESLVTQLVFDFLEQGIFFLDKIPKLMNI